MRLELARSANQMLSAPSVLTNRCILNFIICNWNPSGLKEYLEFQLRLVRVYNFNFFNFETIFFQKKITKTL